VGVLGLITIVAHFLIPNSISLWIAQLLTFFNSFFNLVLEGEHNTIPSAKSPPQQKKLPNGTPYISQSLNTSLIKRLNKIGERGQPCRTPFMIRKGSEHKSLTLTCALEDKYKFLINWKHLPLIPRQSILCKISPIGTES